MLTQKIALKVESVTGKKVGFKNKENIINE